MNKKGTTITAILSWVTTACSLHTPVWHVWWWSNPARLEPDNVPPSGHIPHYCLISQLLMRWHFCQDGCPRWTDTWFRELTLPTRPMWLEFHVGGPISTEPIPAYQWVPTPQVIRLIPACNHHHKSETCQRRLPAAKSSWLIILYDTLFISCWLSLCCFRQQGHIVTATLEVYCNVGYKIVKGLSTQ